MYAVFVVLLVGVIFVRRIKIKEFIMIKAFYKGNQIDLESICEIRAGYNIVYKNHGYKAAFLSNEKEIEEYKERDYVIVKYDFDDEFMYRVFVRI